MTICTTFSAVFATPLLTQYLAGAYVPVDAAGLALSTLQVSDNACGKAIIVLLIPQKIDVLKRRTPLLLNLP